MPEYAVTLIPSPLDAVGARAISINAKGQIVGYAFRPDNSYHGFLWDNGVVTDLGTLSGGHVSFATDINDAGQICGWSDTPKQGPARAFLWHKGVMKDLGVIGGISSIAGAVNAAGEVAGESTIAAGGVHAFKWSNGVMQDLGTLNGQDSWGNDINDAGDVVGHVGDAAFLYSGGSMVAIPSFQSAYAIDNAGEIVGGAEACFRDAMGNIIAAPAVQSDSVATSLNESKRVVGWVYGGSPSSDYAFRWDVATQDFENLNDLVGPLDNGDSLTAAWDIN
jgi:probable HAF family extracellular repeat protein